MTLSIQWITMLVMFSSGLIMAIFLDLVRIVQERYQVYKRLDAFINLFYWVLSAILVFHLLWWSNGGELRFYVFVVICLGFFLYLRFLSDRIRCILIAAVGVGERLGRAVLFLLQWMIWKPLRNIFAMLRSVVWGALLIPYSLIKKRYQKNQEKK